MSLVIRNALIFDQRRWGPTWAVMKETAYWLGTNGVYFYFDSQCVFDDDETDGLPSLFLRDRRWDIYEVRRGDYLILIEPGKVDVISPRHFKEQYREVS